MDEMSKWIGQVLENVAGKDKVQTSIGNRQAIGGANLIKIPQGSIHGPRSFGIVELNPLLGRCLFDVNHFHVRTWQDLRLVSRANLCATATRQTDQIAPVQLTIDSEKDRGIAGWPRMDYQFGVVQQRFNREGPWYSYRKQA